MVTTSKEANNNYLAKIIKLDGLRKHPNADRLQIQTVDFQNVITGMDAKDGDIYVFFPVDSKINHDFLSHTNSFRDKYLNKDKEKSGFFDKPRVRGMLLRGERSEGYMVPLHQMIDFAGDSDFEVGQYFDTWNGIKMVEKYIVSVKNSGTNVKQPKQPKDTRLIENQFRLHDSTENLRKNIYRIKLTDNVSVSYKLHGCQVSLTNLLVKRKLSWVERLAQKLGIKVQDTEYDYIYSSRKVIKNAALTDKEYNHFYSEDIWTIVNEEVKHNIPKGYSLYGEIVGFLPNDGAIQSMNGKPYDYGCGTNEHKLFVYRITFTNSDGMVSELTTRQVQEFCTKYGFETPHVYFTGKYSDFIRNVLRLDPGTATEEQIIRGMEAHFNEKDCWMCTNKVPEEGIVLKVEHLDNFEAYKLKSFRFLEGESNQEEADIETTN